MGQICSNCGGKATSNIQKLWVKWKYDAENDEHSPEPTILDIEPLLCENLYLCNECEQLWERGDI